MALGCGREASTMSLAERVEGRTIHITVDVWLRPPKGQPVGETDAAIEVGRGLIREAFGLLKAAGEAEGFVVELDARQVVI